MADNIDITINETVENIDIVVNPNLIEVNITRVEGASVDGLVPYIGATDDVNLGSFDLTANNVNVDVVNFDLNPIVPTSVGSLYWDNVNKTLSLIDGVGASTLQIGQEERVLIKNTTGATLTDGQIVYITGATGNLPSVSLASALNETTSAATLGMVTETITNGSSGFVTITGLVNGLNTLAFNEGDILWLSNTAGEYTNVKPTSPSHLVLIGYVTKKSAQGSVYVKIQNTQELNECSDVLFGTLSNNDLLIYESSTGLWKNKQLSTLLGGTDSQFIKGNGSLDSTTYATQSALNTEITNRTNADATLTTNLATEINNRTSANLLKEDIANKSTNVTTDGASDTKYPSVKSVKTYVDASATTASTALANEITRATNAENTIATNLTAETTARTAADATLTTNLNSEIARATAAELILTNNLANKQNSLALDGTGVKFPTVDAVNSGLNLKLDKTNLFNTDVASNPPSSFATSSYDAFPLMLKTLSNKIKIFYRVGAAHVDNTGVIVMKTSTDGGATYTSASTIISESGVDCRNISGGITPTGRIILYFLKYNATSLLSISQGYIYSDDEGATWSTYTTIETNSHTFYSPYGGLVNIGDGKIMQPWYGETGTSTYSTYVKISSDNGATWNTSVLVATSPTTKYGEASYAYLDGGTIIGIVRNSLGAVLQQVKSTDNGATWAVVGATTFDTGAHVSPTLYTFSDTNNEKYLACFYANRTDNKLKVVIGSYTSLITDVNGWDINTRTDLTTHTSTDFGYPTVVKSLNNNKFLIALYKASSASVANINFLNFTPLYNSITSIAGIKTSNLFRNNRGIGTHLLIDNASNLNRWAWQMINAESTGNAGSDLNLLYFNDAGTTLGSYMTFTRSSGLSSFVGQIRSISTTAVGFYQARKSDTSGSGVFGGNSFALRNGSTSEDLNFDIYNRTSSTWYTPMIIKNTGNVLIGTTTDNGYKLNINGNLSLGLNASAPTGVEGAIYYNSTTKKHYGFNGTIWNALY